MRSCLNATIILSNFYELLKFLDLKLKVERIEMDRSWRTSDWWSHQATRSTSNSKFLNERIKTQLHGIRRPSVPSLTIANHWYKRRTTAATLDSRVPGSSANYDATKSRQNVAIRQLFGIRQGIVRNLKWNPLPLTSIHLPELWCSTRLEYFFRTGHTTGSFRMHWVYKCGCQRNANTYRRSGPMKIEHF